MRSPSRFLPSGLRDGPQPATCLSVRLLSSVVTRVGSFHFCYAFLNAFREKLERKAVGLGSRVRNPRPPFCFSAAPKGALRMRRGEGRAGPRIAPTCACRRRFFSGGPAAGEEVGVRTHSQPTTSRRQRREARRKLGEHCGCSGR